MTIKLRHVSNFLRVVKLHENENKSLEKEVEKTFELQPVIENVYQNYNEFKKFCLNAKILKLKKDNFEFTKLGEEILENYKGDYLNKKQEELFIEECFLSGNLSKKVLPLLAEFNEEDSKFWFPITEIVGVCKNPEILPMLYEIKLLEKKEPKVFINEKFTNKIQKLTVGRPKQEISQKQIDDSLKIMKKIGNLGEEIALEYERERLVKLDCEKEAQNVERISEEVANAGYDIRSFSGKSDDLIHDRFIEVKSSTDSEFSIHWSHNEMEVAKKYPDNYWIYFIPKIDLLNQTSDEPILIQNPIKNVLENGDYDKKSESLHITKS
jgi:hypothetical protein